MPGRFRDRYHAGEVLAEKLRGYRGRTDTVVLGLARGGVPVAHRIAEALGAPLDVFVVRKLGVPGHRDLAMGAIASGGLLVINPDVVQELGITRAVIEAVSASETQELQRREHDYRADRQPIALRGKSVILVDDGLATGASMRAAVAAVKAFDPARVVVAVPVAASEVCRRLEAEVDEVVCAVTPPDFAAVGFWYEDFSQTTDDEVRDLLHLHTQC